MVKSFLRHCLTFGKICLEGKWSNDALKKSLEHSRCVTFKLTSQRQADKTGRCSFIFGINCDRSIYDYRPQLACSFNVVNKTVSVIHGQTVPT